MNRFSWGQRADRGRDDDAGDSEEKQDIDIIDDAAPNLILRCQLVSAAGLPAFTNYTRDFKDLLDYIFVENNAFEVVRVAPFPSEAILSAQTALPSEFFPSDHLAVAVDLKFKRR